MNGRNLYRPTKRSPRYSARKQRCDELPPTLSPFTVPSRRNLAKLGQPVDRQEWYLLPHVVNALNSPQQNSIIFPAAILQPPFFDPHADPAVNYGGIGSVIGHEIVHSFDDVGAQFDASGKVANWWTKEDASRFKAASQVLVEQYNTSKPFPELAVNGQLTLGENIADVAGVAVAHDGYVLSLGGKPAPVLDGFTGDQRFYLGFAQIWRRKYREPILRAIVMTDGHSRASTAPPRCATRTPGTGPSTSSPARRSTWPPKSASASGSYFCQPMSRGSVCTGGAPWLSAASWNAAMSNGLPVAWARFSACSRRRNQAWAPAK